MSAQNGDLGSEAKANPWVYANKEIWNALGYQTWTVPEGQALIGQDGTFNPLATPGYSNGRYYFKGDDWEKESLVHGLRQEYNASISGGNNKFNYYLSGSYLGDEGLIEGSHFDRVSTRLNVDYQAKKWLKVGANMTYTYTNSGYPGDQTLDASTSSGNAFYFINTLGPVYPMYVRNPDGSIKYNETYGRPIYDFGDGADYGNGLIGSTRTPTGNPAGILQYDKEDYLADVFDGKWYAIVTPFDGSYPHRNHRLPCRQYPHSLSCQQPLRSERKLRRSEHADCIAHPLPSVSGHCKLPENFRRRPQHGPHGRLRITGLPV